MRFHISMLSDGELFRYQPDGPVFRIAAEKDKKGKILRYLCQHADGELCQLWAVAQFEGAFVYPFEPGEDSDDAVS